MSAIEQMIQDKAYASGYMKCGIIPVQAFKGYEERLRERIQKVPSAAGFYQKQKRLTNIQQEYPWAKSVIVAAVFYGKYKIPEPIKGHIGKSYLFDMRTDTGSVEFQNSCKMEKYLEELGLRIASNRKFGVAALRWAAMKAGLGRIRKNNFFYTESGSWVHLEGWLTDREMELVETSDLPACPEGCNRCINACPSRSLSSPYTMHPGSCVSFLTTFGGRNLPDEPLRNDLGKWIYGCDECQDACPMNKGKWNETEEFQGASELSPHLAPESIMEMEEPFYRSSVQPKFFYLTSEELWKWKVNALCFMRNQYQESYKPYIIAACENENEKIREMAQLICSELFGQKRDTVGNISGC
jgi:epoxyqueuosine reductase